MSEPRAQQPQTVGGIASAEQGLVLLDGPDGVAVSMTAQAAQDTAHSLLAAAETAQGQHADPESS